jgi:signal transduction histidine kinase
MRRFSNANAISETVTRGSIQKARFNVDADLMTLRTRLSLTIAGIGTVLVLASIYAIGQLGRLREIASEQRSRHGEAYIAMGAMQTQLAELSSVQRAYVAQVDEDAIAAMRQGMLTSLTTLREQVTRLREANYHSLSRYAARNIDQLGVATRRIELLKESGRQTEAYEYFENDVRPLFAAAQETTTRIIREIDDRSQSDLERAGDISARARTTAVFGMILAVGVAGLLGLWTTRALTLPVVRLRNAMAVVADGDFTLPRDLAYERNDEIGSASRSFRAMTNRLAELDRLKAEFVSIATHELRTPLNVISGYAELISEGVYGEPTAGQREAVETIRDQTRVVSQLVSQLLDLSRLEAGGLRLEIKPEKSAELFHRVERAFAPLAQRRGITFSVSVDTSVPESIPMDLDRMGDQVIGNLISNALKFTPEGGSVTIDARDADGWLLVTIEDTGCGIPGAQLPFVFDKFYQVGDDARKKGAGLGLTIAHDVVKAHGGTITAESEVDKGTIFRVRLPPGGRLMTV